MSWEPAIARELTQELVDGLLDQSIAYVRIPGVLSVDWCREILRRFLAFMETHPDHRIRLTPNPHNEATLDAVAFPMNLFLQSGSSAMESYLEAAGRNIGEVRRIFEGGTDPLEVTRGAVRGLQWIEVPPLEGTRRCLSDTLMGAISLPKAVPHVDSYQQKAKGIISTFPHRINFNTFVQSASGGGNFRVYRQRRTGPEFHPESVPFAEYEVAAGDLIVFDSGNYHEVRSMSGDRHRLLSHMAVGFDPATRKCAIYV